MKKIFSPKHCYNERYSILKNQNERYIFESIS